MTRVMIGDLDLSTIDADPNDTRYIFDEVFGSAIYHHDRFVFSEAPIILDVGANIGIFAIWAHRRFSPATIQCYEASPRTFASLQDNVARLIDPAVTRCRPVNRAVAGSADRILTLHQSTRVSGISTLLDPKAVGWIGAASDRQELETHEIRTTTVSNEIIGLPAIDLLKIDVEGYFLEVLSGIAEPDFARIRNVVIEVDYLPETGIRPDDVETLLRDRGYRTDCLDRSLDNNLTFYAWRE